MVQTKAPGAPLGSPGAILFPEFQENAKASNYGDLPWYRDPGKERFPDGMCLIVDRKKIGYDIRSDGTFFHIVSKLFLECVEKSGGDLEDCKSIEIRLADGSLVSKDYSVCRFRAHSIEDVCALEATEYEQIGSRIVPSKITISQQFAPPIFKIRDMSPRVDFVFCSEQVQEAAKRAKLRGVSFENVKSAAWEGSGSFGQDYLSMALGGTSLRFPV